MAIMFCAILRIVIILSILFFKNNSHAVDFFFMASIVYLFVFSLAPMIFHLSMIADAGNYEKINTQYDRNNLSYSYSSIIALISYLIMLFGYKLSGKTLIKENKIDKHCKESIANSEKKVNTIIVLSILFALSGIMSFIVYLNSTGSWVETIKYSAYYRSNPLITKYSYMKNIAPLVVVSSYFAFSLIMYKKQNSFKVISYMLFFVTLVSSAIVLFHQAGRLNIFLYIMTFPFAYCLISGKGFRYITLIGVLLFCFIIFFGKEIFNVFIDSGSLVNKSEMMISDSSIIFYKIVNELSFPMFNISNAVDVVPRIVPFRYFSDIIYSIYNTMPNSWLPAMSMQQSISSINTSFFATSGAVPVDLITFGYYSLGVPGVLIVMFCFGMTLYFFDWYFPHSNDPVWATFRVAWIFFLPMRIVYGDPTIILKVGFALMIGTMTLLIFFPKTSSCIVRNP